MAQTENPVLIVGAGPTGLVLALWLTKAGIKVRLIDKTDRPGTTSRALVIHARTLEFYRQLGIADQVVQRALRFPHVNIWVQNKIKATLDLGATGTGQSPFPYVLIFPQDEHEAFLIAELKNLGVEVERQVELLSFSQEAQKVKATVKNANGLTEDILCDYLAGCDGARSIVRHQLGTGFEGSTYPDLFYVADIEGTGPALNGDLNLTLNTSEFLAIFPLKKQGQARLIGVLRDVKEGQEVRWDDVHPQLMKQLRLEIKAVNWFSTYHVHHRVALHFQFDRVFLLGDAGHIHSPVGGQGMNTGIGDAVNLGWKLAEVIKGNSPAELLKTYEPERIAFARKLVQTTDQAFQIVTSTGRWAQFIRTRIVPFILPKFFKWRGFRPLIFRTLSQTGISYRNVPFNHGEAGSLKGGDRLPWIESVDNFAPLKSRDWQVHVYGDLKVETKRPVFHFDWNDEMARKGLQKNTAYLIRPDGYIGVISTRNGIELQVQNH